MREENSGCQLDNGPLCKAYGLMWKNTERWKLEREQRRYKMFLAWAGWGGGVGRQRAKEMSEEGTQIQETFVYEVEKQMPDF